MSRDETTRQKINIIDFQIWLAERDLFNEDYQEWCSQNGYNPDETGSKEGYITALKNTLEQLKGNSSFSPSLIATTKLLASESPVDSLPPA